MNDHPKELRLAFAMGGGVSLGTFSGAALSECLTLLLRHGVATGRYSRVTIDVFSGASAGAVSLVLLLRSLTHRSPEAAAAARSRLEELPEWHEYPETLQNDLVAAEAVQALQRQLWVDDLNLDLLLSDPLKNLRHQAAILNRHAIDALAADYIAFDAPPQSRLANTALLATRVLFACTLSNLTPIVADATHEVPGSEVGFAGLMDAMTSGVHQEVRVFDLRFEEIPEPELPPAGKAAQATLDRWPARWQRYHAGPERPNQVGDLRHDRAWAVLASTAIAAAAFPVAFEPVVLSRNSYEYGDDWPSELRVGAFAKTGSVLASGETHYEYPFTYVDGGIFNNEPLREAFKLAAYLDASSDPDTFVRRVIYVDPIVSMRPRSYGLASHRAYRVADAGPFGLGGRAIRRSPTLNRLASLAPALIQSVVNEAKVNEGNRTATMRNVLEERDKLRALVSDMVIGDPEKHLRPLADRCRAILDAKRRRQMIPPGPVTLAGALRQTLYQDKDRTLDPESADEVLARIDAAETIDRADEWLKALNMLAFGLIADTEAKRLDAKVVAIAPIRNPEAEALNDVDAFELPGAELMGFAGFMSARAGERDFEIGQWCAHNYLRLCELIDVDPPDQPPLNVSETDAEAIAAALKKGSKRLARRLNQILAQRLDFESRLATFAAPLFLIGAFRRRAIAGWLQKVPRQAPNAYVFQINVPGRNFELDGPDTIEVKTRPCRMPEDGRRAIITVATLNGHGWEGIHVANGTFRIVRRDVSRVLRRAIDPIALPGDDLVERAKAFANPVFAYDIEAPERGWQLLPGVEPLERRLLQSRHD